MKFKEPLYFESPGHVKKTYTDIPTKDIDLDRLIQGLSPFIDTSASSVQKSQKTLIINLDNQDTFSFFTSRAGNHYLNERYQEGFPIYLYNNGELLTYPAEMNKIQPHRMSGPNPLLDLTVCSKALDVAENELAVINHEIIDLIKSGCDACLLEDSTILSLKIDNEATALLIKRTMMQDLLSSKSVNDEDIPLPSLDLSKIENELLQTYPQFRAIQLDSYILQVETLYELLHTYQIESLTIADCGFTELNIPEKPAPHLKELNIHSSYGIAREPNSPIPLKKLLTNTPNLKELRLERLEDDLCEELDTPITLALLEVLMLEFISLSANPQALENLLCHTQSLKVLHLWGCGELPDITMSLPALEILILDYTQASPQTLNNLITHAKSLKKLDLMGFEDINAALDTPFNLSSLRELFIDDAPITVDSLKNVLIHAQALQTLKLTNCDDLNGELDTPLILPLLEELDLTNSPVTTETVKNLLVHTSALKKLCLEGCKNIDLLSCLSAIHLDHLEELNLTNLPLTEIIYEYILANTPNLKTLIIDENIDIDFINNNHIPPNLQIKINEAPKPQSVHSAQHLPASNAPRTDVENKLTTPVKPGKTTVDANTQFKKSTFNINRIFTGKPKAPSPSHLRYGVYDTLELKKETSTDPFILDKKPANTPRKIVSQAIPSVIPLATEYQGLGDNHYFARIPLMLTPEWQPIPSAFADERLLKYYVASQREIDIEYDEETNLHYIRGRGQETSQETLEILLDRPNPTDHINDLPAEVRALIRNCLGYRDEALITVGSHATGEAYIKALLQERTGACRHRSVAFLYRMQHEHPDIPVRIIGNEVHMYAEVYCTAKNCWITCDLGGHDAKLVINESNLPEYETPREEALRPENTTQMRWSDGEKPLSPDFFQNAQNLTTLNIDHASILPLYEDLSKLDTLSISNSPLDSAELNQLFQQAPNLKTLTIAHCTISPEAFNQIDFSCLQQLEYVKFTGAFIPDLESVQNIKQTSPPGCRWVIEGDHLSETHALESLETRKKPRQLPKRYFAERTEKKTKLKAFDILNKKPDTVRVDTKDIESVRLELQQVAHDISRDSFFVDSPGALQDVTVYLERQGDLGVFQKGHGSPFYQFLMEDTGKEKVVIIDFTQFTTAEIVKYNCLLDDPPTFLNEPLPKHIQIIGLTNSKADNAYQGADFYSRFSHAVEITNVTPRPPLKPILSAEIPEKGHVIELCGGENWQSRLLGHWSFKNQAWVFEEGLLIKALKENNKTILFNHAPLHDLEFVQFIHDLELHGKVMHKGRYYAELPKNFTYGMLEETRLPHTASWFNWENETTKPAQCTLLNEKTLSHFFEHYDYEPPKENEPAQPLLKSGLIEQYKKPNTLHVYVSSSLSFMNWLKICEECQRCGTILQVSLAPGVQLPAELQIPLPEQQSRETFTLTDSTLFNPPTIPSKKEIIQIDISELDAAQLLATFKMHFNKDTHELSCTPLTFFPWEALKNGETVILRGQWTKELAEAVQVVIAARLKETKAPGKLIILSEQPHLFLSLPPTPCAFALYPSKPLIKQQVDFTSRLVSVEAALVNQLFVVLTGPSGAGKTHFVKHDWKQKHPDCYFGEDEIESWLKNSSQDDYVTLFIDEANLANKNWSLFEGLFYQPPGIYYNNQFYPLSEKHRIIFAGNPATFGGERTTPTLFKHHPQEIQFESIPAHEIHKELSTSQEISKSILNEGQTIFDLYAWVSALDPNDTLLTLREIRMMFYLTESVAKQYPHIEPSLFAQYFAYTIALPHIPKTRVKEFNVQFKPAQIPLKIEAFADLINREKKPGHKGNEWILNDSNLEATLALRAHLDVRDKRLAENITSLRVGLGGLVLEGEAGEAKSLMIGPILATHGLREGIDFCYLPASLSYDEKVEQLTLAFHQGKIVIIEEINSSPMIERLLNALLEGHDLKDNPPQKPGFMIIGTQNPVTYGGRVKTTLPLKHRLQTVQVPTSTLKEKKQILQQLGLPTRISQNMLEEYSQHPALCFRDAVKSAKRWLEHPLPSVKHDLQPIKQQGEICKTVAIANVEAYYAKKLNYPPIPLWSERKPHVSVRQIVKYHGSLQGEILEFDAWQKALDTMGFETETVDFENNMLLFIETIVNNLKQGNLPLIAFPLNRNSGLPDPDSDEPHETEHAAVITGYDHQMDTFTVAHWGKTYTVDAVNLFNAAHVLPETSTQENTGFKTKLLIVKQPDKKTLEEKRKYLHQPFLEAKKKYTAARMEHENTEKNPSASQMKKK